MTIPRAELNALFIAATLCSAAKRNLKPFATKLIAFTDSLVSLYWVVNERSSLELFHRVRCATIRQTFTDDDGELNIYWVSSLANVSDLGTKLQCTPQDLSPEGEFFLGPPFLTKKLEQAEEEGIIIKAKNLKFKMTPEQQKAIDDGSTNKQKVHPTTLVTSANINKTKELFFIGNYLVNPLKMNFKKYLMVNNCLQVHSHPTKVI